MREEGDVKGREKGRKNSEERDEKVGGTQQTLPHSEFDCMSECDK